jgi:hypothetical protein
VKRIHLLRVEAPPEAFAPLISAARAAGLRLGWLASSAAASIPPPMPLPAELRAAAAAGVLRAVAVGEGLAAVVKPLVGPPVLRDLMREHFRGCAAVLVGGPLAPPDAPALAPAPDGADGWRVALPGGERTFSTAGLVARLRRPRPWGEDAALGAAGSDGASGGSR